MFVYKHERNTFFFFGVAQGCGCVLLWQIGWTEQGTEIFKFQCRWQLRKKLSLSHWLSRWYFRLQDCNFKTLIMIQYEVCRYALIPYWSVHWQYKWIPRWGLGSGADSNCSYPQSTGDKSHLTYLSVRLQNFQAPFICFTPILQDQEASHGPFYIFLLQQRIYSQDTMLQGYLQLECPLESSMTGALSKIFCYEDTFNSNVHWRARWMVRPSATLRPDHQRTARGDTMVIGQSFTQ